MKRLAIVLGVLFLLPVPAVVGANDPLRGLQYGLDQIEAEAAWARARGAGVAIAILDTGIDLQHEDLRDRLIPGRDFIDDDDLPQDLNGHGTHVAGIAAATTDNGIGIAGAAPGASLMPLRVLDAEGTGVESDVAAAIRLAVQRTRVLGMKLVVNLSLTDLEITGVVTSSRQIEDAIREAWQAGAVIVAAAGNEDLPFGDFPAAGPNVISVGATDEHGNRAPFSNRGPLLVAPGDKIVSTFWDPATPNDHGAYASGSGTSMAAPHVSGVAALLLSSGLNNQDTVARIISTADDLGVSGEDADFGYGRVNAAAAFGLLTSSSPVARPPDEGTVPDGKFEKIGTAAVPHTPSPEAAPPPLPEPVPAGARLPVASAAVAIFAVAAGGAAWSDRQRPAGASFWES